VGLKCTRAILRCVQINAALACFNGLPRFAIFAVGHHIIGNAAVELGFEQCLGELLWQLRDNTVFSGNGLFGLDAMMAISKSIGSIIIKSP